jgi:hypothetical protein
MWIAGITRSPALTPNARGSNLRPHSSNFPPGNEMRSKKPPTVRPGVSIRTGPIAGRRRPFRAVPPFPYPPLESRSAGRLPDQV